ncbi:MAG: TipAS antibiotic-recognition domain-containing protein [Coriobacteriia bacterium]|nr:TipAS antibiotic-recognition domain-containing protein [Coriobacteriia bacterium]MCL2750990.1 TipAS antibiotic-recognition domain-containing protein [Coriobacteriia bacterium]
MDDDEKFEEFKKSIIDENEQQYGAEIRENYGADIVEEANAHLNSLSREQFDTGKQLRFAFEETLSVAFTIGDPAGELAQKACDLHKQWLCIYYPHYTKEYHKGLAELYLSDERFKENYDKLAPGCAEFLYKAIHIYCDEG